MRRARRHLMAEINVVPYIDVMLVLLIIFMITAPLLTQGVDVELPKAEAKAVSSSEKMPIVVSVNKKGEYFLNIAKKPDAPVNSNVLVNRVAAQLRLDAEVKASRKVFVRGDAKARYSDVMQAMVNLQKAGAEHVGLITDPSMGAVS